MLYVFRVDTGTMLEMEMNLALETVDQLKTTIERTCNIPVDKQVLLVSGGQCLELTARVCTYSAGTDTNPIFLFRKSFLENRSLTPPLDDDSDGDVTEKVARALDLPSTYNTVVSRVALAQEMCSLAKEVGRDCESLVHDQHLQQQGWAAAVANLEDVVALFRDRSVAFEKDYESHLSVREENLAVLGNFSEDLNTLSRIPILPPLLASAISLSGLELETKVTAMTLLEWISAKDNQSSLQLVAEQCASFLEQLSPPVLHDLMRKCDEAFDLAGQVDMKEIKGLSERLCGLETLMMHAKRAVQEQLDLAQGFQQNQYRANNLGDASILPDLCNSHRRQLCVMMENHSKLKDIRSRCLKAKTELSESLKHRLRWVVFAQNEILKVGNDIMILQDSLKRGRRHFMIVRQVQRAPEMYCLAVAEAVRRRKFSRAFLKWASDLANRLLATYNEETERRREFKLQFGGHFLEALFPGLEDEPPSYATKAPEPFDALLPDLSEEDMEKLRETLPDLALRISWTELSSVAQMILSKQQMESKEDSKDDVPVEDRLVAAVSQVGLSDQMDESLLRQDDVAKLREDRELESETDTDEFEKVSKAPLNRDGQSKESLSEAVQQQMAAAMAAGKLAVEVTSSLRSELAELRGQSVADKDSILDLVKQIQLHIVQLTEGYVEELSLLHTRFKDSAIENETLVTKMQEDISAKEDALAVSQQELSLLRVQLDEKLREGHQHDLIENDLKERLKVQDEEHKTLLDKLASDKSELEEEKNQIIIEKEKEAEKMLQEAQIEAQLKLNQICEENTKEISILTEQKAELGGSLKKLEVELEELTQRLVQTEMTAELELENKAKELEAEHAKIYSELETKLSQEHSAELQEVTDRLAAEYKTELGSLRSRFRLMSITSMEKSPSDSSLEKIERGEMIELVNHEAIIAQTKEDAEIAQEKAVALAVEAEQNRSRAWLDEQRELSKARMEEEKQVWLQEAVTRALAERERQAEEEMRIAKERLEENQLVAVKEAVAAALAEKDREIENFRARHQTLTTECQRHRDTIRLLTEGEHLRSLGGAGTHDPLLHRVEALEKERKELLEKLATAQGKPRRTRRLTGEDIAENEMVSSSYSSPVKAEDMGQSVVIESQMSTSPLSARARDKMTNSMREVAGKGGKICLTSCGPDDPVLVLWNVELANYVILQESPTLYFLHSDCLDTLGLRPSSDGSPRRLYATAVVVNKEYCHAKKSENRYGVPKGTKFYRVMVRQMPRDRLDTSLPRPGSSDVSLS